MSQAKDGDKVKVHYTGKLEDGEVFDTSEGRPPFEFVIGQNQVIPGFEQGIVGMTVGDKKTVTIPPEKAYGQYQDEMTVEVNKKDFPDDLNPEIGMQLQMKRADGAEIGVRVKGIQEEMVTLDANHPLAGKTLVFDIELIGLG